MNIAALLREVASTVTVTHVTKLEETKLSQFLWSNHAEESIELDATLAFTRWFDHTDCCAMFESGNGRYVVNI